MFEADLSNTCKYGKCINSKMADSQFCGNHRCTGTTAKGKRCASSLNCGINHNNNTKEVAMGRTQTCNYRKCHTSIPFTGKPDFCSEHVTEESRPSTTKSISNTTKVIRKTGVAGERITMSLADYEVFKAAQK